jgi:hypothetical protein
VWMAAVHFISLEVLRGSPASQAESQISAFGSTLFGAFDNCGGGYDVGLSR